jgi:hypothetical protein
VNPDFRNLVESLDPKFQALMAMAPVRYGSLPRNVPKRGIYLFSEGPKHLHVGRTNNMRSRLGGHCRPSSGHFSGTFAFRLARKETGMLKAAYSASGSRSALLKDAKFKSAFDGAKARLAGMDVRFVEEEDATRQALLEMYVAVALKTPFNDFDNH